MTKNVGESILFERVLSVTYECKYKQIEKSEASCIKAFEEWSVCFATFLNQLNLFFLNTWLSFKLDILAADENDDYPKVKLKGGGL